MWLKRMVSHYYNEGKSCSSNAKQFFRPSITFQVNLHNTFKFNWPDTWPLPIPVLDIYYVALEAGKVFSYG